METNGFQALIPEERIATKILQIRHEKVILDFDLAVLYGIETRTLKQAVRRNIDRFPVDFMFELTDSEADNLVSQNVIPSKSHLGGSKPFAFTEPGVAMLSSVLKSKQAIDMNITIMRTFVMLRNILTDHQSLLIWKDQIEKELSDHGEQILKIMEYLNQLGTVMRQEEEFRERRRVGFRQGDE